MYEPITVATFFREIHGPGLEPGLLAIILMNEGYKHIYFESRQSSKRLETDGHIYRNLIFPRYIFHAMCRKDWLSVADRDLPYLRTGRTQSMSQPAESESLAPVLTLGESLHVTRPHAQGTCCHDGPRAGAKAAVFREFHVLTATRASSRRAGLPSQLRGRTKRPSLPAHGGSKAWRPNERKTRECGYAASHPI